MILLTSSVATVAKHLHEHYLKDLNLKSILFIDTAAELEIGHEEGDDDWLIADFESLQNVGYEVKRYSVTDKSPKEIEQEINRHDIIYMCGGNTIYLLQQLQETKSFDLIKQKVLQGKPYIGTSAGSIVAGEKIPTYLEDSEGIKLDDYTGFQFTNCIIVPHWGNDYFKKMYLNERLEKAYLDNEPLFVLLSDYNYLNIEKDGSATFVNTKNTA